MNIFSITIILNHILGMNNTNSKIKKNVFINLKKKWNLYHYYFSFYFPKLNLMIHGEIILHMLKKFQHLYTGHIKPYLICSKAILQQKKNILFNMFLKK